MKRGGQVNKRSLLTVAAALGGLVLFAYALRREGIDQIVSGVRRVGWGLLPILVLAGARFVLRAQCWRLCMPPHARFSLPRAFAAFLSGDAVGNITPLGMAASEPTKVLLSRRQMATREAVASLAIDNLVYGASVACVVAIGLLVALSTVSLPLLWKEALLIALTGMAIVTFVAFRLMRGTWTEADGQRPAWRSRLSTLRQSVLEFSSGHPRQLGIVFGLHMLFHALAAFEGFLTLRWLLGDASITVAQAIVFESLNRVVTVLFKFVPFRVGVDETLSGALASVLALPTAAGVTLAVVRKIRNLFWTGVGLLLIAYPDQADRVRGRLGNGSARPT